MKYLSSPITLPRAALILLAFLFQCAGQCNAQANDPEMALYWYVGSAILFVLSIVLMFRTSK